MFTINMDSEMFTSNAKFYFSFSFKIMLQPGHQQWITRMLSKGGCLEK